MKHLFHRFFILLTLGVAGCTSKSPDPAPATLPGHWTLVSQHLIQTNVPTGQVVLNQTLAGRPGFYLEISSTMFEEYADNQLALVMPYTHSGGVITLNAPISRLNQQRNVVELSQNRLILNYTLPVTVADQSLAIEAVYSR